MIKKKKKTLTERSSCVAYELHVVLLLLEAGWTVYLQLVIQGEIRHGNGVV